MVQPIDYMSMIPQPDLGGAAIRFSSVLRQNRERDAALAKQKEAEEKAAQRELQYRQELEQAYKSKNPEDFSRLVTRYPEQREPIVAAVGMLSPAQKEQEFRDSLNLYQALSVSPEYAKTMLKDRIQAEQNAGNDTRELELLLAQAKADPDMAQGHLSLILSSIDQEKWDAANKERRSRGLESFEKTKVAADAQKAAIDAGFYNSKLALELQEKQWNIENLMEDAETKRQNRKLAVLNKQLGATQDDLKARKLQAEIDKLENDRDTKIKDRVAEGESRILTVDNAISTVDEALDFSPDTYASITGWFDAMTPTINKDAARLEGIIETLQSQIFLNNVESLKGPATDKDAEELKISIKNLNLSKNDPTSLRQNLERIQQLLTQMRASTIKQYGMPEKPIDSPKVKATYEDLLQIIQQEVSGFLETLKGAEQTIQNPQFDSATPSDGNLVREIFP